MSEEQTASIRYKCNDKKKDVKFMSFDTSDETSLPIKDYAERLLYGNSMTLL